MLDGKITKNDNVITQMRDLQNKLKVSYCKINTFIVGDVVQSLHFSVLFPLHVLIDVTPILLQESAANRKKGIAAEYQQMRDLLAREERDALNAVDRELESGQTKLKVLMKKFAGNIDSMSKAKEDIRSLLAQCQTLAFLQVGSHLSMSDDTVPVSQFPCQFMFVIT